MQKKELKITMIIYKTYSYFHKLSNGHTRYGKKDKCSVRIFTGPVRRQTFRRPFSAIICIRHLNFKVISYLKLKLLHAKIDINSSLFWWKCLA